MFLNSGKDVRLVFVIFFSFVCFKKSEDFFMYFSNKVVVWNIFILFLFNLVFIRLLYYLEKLDFFGGRLFGKC